MSVIDKFFKFKSNTGDFCTAVIVAAGNSQRMGRDKIMMPLGDRPVIAHTLAAFQKCKLIDEIVVVTRPERLQQIADICQEFDIDKIRKIIVGGKTRAQSAYLGVLEASENASLIAIHDGARPFVSEAVIDRTVNSAKQNHAAAPAVYATDTVRIVNTKGVAVSTPDRDTVALIQTPQVFDADLIRNALTKAVKNDLRITDDCSAVEAMGAKVTVVAGEQTNIKLTSEADVYIAEKILADRGTGK